MSLDREKVLNVLKSESLSYNEIVEKSGLNSRYVSDILSDLIAKKRATRTPQPSTGFKGRPKVIYSLIQKPKPIKKINLPNQYSHIKSRTGIKKLKLEQVVRQKPRVVEKPKPKVDYNKIMLTCKFKNHQGLCRHGRFIKTKVRCSKWACPLC